MGPEEIVIDHPAREGSGLLAVTAPEILEAHGWDLAFWTCSDEAPVEDSLAALGRSRDTGAWEVVHPAITGNLDSDPEESVLVQDHPEGTRAKSCHHRLIFPQNGEGKVGAEEVHLLKDQTKVEGMSLDSEGCFWYVLDDEKIRLLRVESPPH